MEVTATNTPTNPDRTDLGITLDNKTTAELPLVSRNPYNFILLQPNVSGIANTEFGVPRKVDATALMIASITKSTEATTRRATAPGSD